MNAGLLFGSARRIVGGGAPARPLAGA